MNRVQFIVIPNKYEYTSITTYFHKKKRIILQYTKGGKRNTRTTIN